MLIKKKLILMLFSLIFLSCNSENDSIKEPENTQPIKYTFVKIEFIKPEQNGNTEYYENALKIEYINRTSITQTYSHNPLNGIYETSQFTGIDSSIINHIINSPIIAVPISADNLGYLGEEKWPISNSTEKHLSSLNLESNILIEANNKMTLKTKINYLKISTNIRLTLIDDKENKVHVFDGKWVGIYPKNAEIETTFTNL